MVLSFSIIASPTILQESFFRFNWVHCSVHVVSDEIREIILNEIRINNKNERKAILEKYF